MTSIADSFARARSEHRAALMPYLMGGFPDLDTSTRVLEAYLEAGADLVELGVPFSDPLADGPVIHDAATRALGAGATLESVLAICEPLAGRAPIVPMVYANMIWARGADRFAGMLADAGAPAAIVPDLTGDGGGEIHGALRARGIAPISLLAPTSSPERRERIGAEAEGFVYLVSDTRTTGERERMPERLGELVRDAQASSAVPVAVGFGIATPEQAAEVGAVADGVIVGTRLVRAVGEAGDAKGAARAVGEFIGAAREAMSAGASR